MKYLTMICLSAMAVACAPKEPVKYLALSFDDGPNLTTESKMLDVLAKHDVPATFFLIGNNINEESAKNMKRALEQGCEIGNHSWSHPSFFKLSPEQMVDQLSRTTSLLEEITGQDIQFFRPPYGDMNEAVRAVVHAAGYEVIRWTHSTGDSGDDATEARSFHGATDKLTGGSIILSHVDSDATTAALPRILDYYRDNGFQVVPVSQLLLTNPKGVDSHGLQY